MDAVYDITIIYNKQRSETPSTFGLCLSKLVCLPSHVDMHVRRFPIKDVPRDPEEVNKWLIDLYVHKDKLIESFFQKGGKFPSPRPDKYAHKFFEIWTPVQAARRRAEKREKGN